MTHNIKGHPLVYNELFRLAQEVDRAMKTIRQQDKEQEAKHIVKSKALPPDNSLDLLNVLNFEIIEKAFIGGNDVKISKVLAMFRGLTNLVRLSPTLDQSTRAKTFSVEGLKATMGGDTPNPEILKFSLAQLKPAR